MAQNLARIASNRCAGIQGSSISILRTTGTAVMPIIGALIAIKVLPMLPWVSLHLLLACSVYVDGNQFLLGGGKVLQVQHQVLTNLLPCIHQQKHDLRIQKAWLPGLYQLPSLYSSWRISCRCRGLMQSVLLLVICSCMTRYLSRIASCHPSCIHL